MSRRLFQITFALFCLSLLGCPSPLRTTTSPQMHEESQLPSDWLEISPTDNRMKYLEISTRQRLADLRVEITLFKRSLSFHQTGLIPQTLTEKMRTLNEECNMEFINSPYILAQSLSPEMYSTMDTNPELYLKNSSNIQQNMRGVVDDWNRWWLIDEPSPLSPYPIVSP